jgi:hypothetical protein
MLGPSCCLQSELLVKGKYLVLAPSGWIVRLVRYSESCSFPISLRVLLYCPFCSKSLAKGSGTENEKHDCLPFKTEHFASLLPPIPEKGHFVCELESGLDRSILFNLISNEEDFPEGRLDYPREGLRKTVQVSFSHC